MGSDNQHIVEFEINERRKRVLRSLHRMVNAFAEIERPEYDSNDAAWVERFAAWSEARELVYGKK